MEDEPWQEATAAQMAAAAVGPPFVVTPRRAATTAYLAGNHVFTGTNTFNTGVVTVNSQLIAKGTATNDSASAGYIGEYSSASLAAGSAVTLTSTVTANVTSMSLTAGDWDVSANAVFNPAAAVNYIWAGISTTSATMGTIGNGSNNLITSPTQGNYAGCPLIPFRISLSGTTTVYLVAQSQFSSTAPTAFGLLRARRMR